jgi:hypothetical protein
MPGRYDSTDTRGGGMQAAGTKAEGTRRRNAFLGPLRSELLKAGSCPLMVGTVLAVVAFSAIASVYLTYMAWSRPDEAAGLMPSSAYQLALPLEQVGFALMGALVLYMDEAKGMPQALLAVPRRGRLLAAKLGTSAIWAAFTAVLSVGVAYASRTAALALIGGTVDVGAPAGGLVRIEALVLWWTLLSVLVTSLSVLARRSMPVLVLSLAMMLVLSSLLRGIAPAAAWLPDQLALCLYQLPSASGDVGTAAALIGLGVWLAVFLMGARLSIARWNP